MFIVILSAVLGLMHLYVWKRLVKDTTRPGRIRWALSGALAALAALLIAALVLPKVVGETRSAWFAWPGFLWFALIAYLFLTLLVLEPVRLALRRWTRPTPKVATDTDDPTPDVGPVAPTSVNRRMFLARASAVAAGAASVGLVGVGTANALGRPNVLHVPVRLRKLDPALRGFRIAVVSDIHLGPLAGRAHPERIPGSRGDRWRPGGRNRRGTRTGRRTVARLALPGGFVLRHRQPRVLRRRSAVLAT
jgi:hypothetical protein